MLQQKKGDKEALNSILSGLDRVNNAYDALKVIKNVEKYKTATRIISDQDFFLVCQKILL